MCHIYDDLSAAARNAIITYATDKTSHPEHSDQCTAALNAHVAQCEDIRCILIRTMWTPEALKEREAQCEKDGCTCCCVRTMCNHGVTQQQRHSASHHTS